MGNLWNGIWWNDNFDGREKIAANEVEKAIIDTDLFILTYIINPDLLIYGVCSKLRENKVSIKGVSDEMLEDVVGPLIHKLFRECFMTEKGRKAFIKRLDREIEKALSNNPNQIEINRVD
jgi:hypothetical protein